MLFRGDFSEKRNFFRMDVGCPMQFRRQDDPTMLTGTVRDLSASGLGFVCQQELSEGAMIEVIISPEKAIVPPLQAMAEVVRVSAQGGDSYEIGVRIVEIL